MLGTLPYLIGVLLPYYVNGLPLPLEVASWHDPVALGRRMVKGLDQRPIHPGQRARLHGERDGGSPALLTGDTT